MNIRDLARPEIAALDPYEAAAQLNDTVRLNANESPVVSDVGKFRRPLNRYPEVRPRGLQTAMAARFTCAAEQLLVTRGSSEAIDLLMRTFCRAGVDSVVTPSPSFSMYRHYAVVQDAKVIEVRTTAESNFAIDTVKLVNACEDTTRLVFVCSPNNPTGTTLRRTDLLILLEARSKHSIVVVDEAYIEFGNEPSAIDLLDQHQNLVILRTLSKALGFAGARCGAVIGSREVIAMLNAVQAPYAMATPVVECVEDAFRDDQLATAGRAVSAIVRERDRVMDAVAKLPFVSKVWPSNANFFLIRVADAGAVMECCSHHGVLVRPFDGDLADCIRISIGSKDDNDRLLVALDKLEGSKQ